MKVHVIIPSYNCAEWIGRALASVVDQDYPDVAVLVIDDASTDPRQRPIIEAYCDGHENWSYQFNSRNMRAGYNLFHGIQAMKPEPEDVVFILDGDDFLPHGRVLSRIAEVYEDPDAWFVYGCYEPWPHNTGQVQSRPYPAEWLADAPNGRLRREENLANHPLSARAFLFAELTADEMADRQGRWFRAGYDRCMFIPMMEMASQGHIRFVDEILYCYNAVNPISDSSANLKDAQAAHRHVASRPARQPLVRW